MTLSFDPDSLSLPIGHFIGDRLVPAANGIDMHRPSDGIEYAGCPKADAALVDEAVQTAKAALKSSNWGGVGRRARPHGMERRGARREQAAESAQRSCSAGPT